MSPRRKTAWAASAVLAGVLGVAAPAAALDGPSVQPPVVSIDPTAGLHVGVSLPPLPVTSPVPTGGPITVDGNRDGLHVTLPGGEIGLDPPPLPSLPKPPSPVLPVLPVPAPAPAAPSGSAPGGERAPVTPAVATSRAAAVAAQSAPGASRVATPPGAVKATSPAVRTLPAGARGAVVTTPRSGSSGLWSAPLRHLGLWLALIGLALIMRAVVASSWRDRAGALSPR